MKDLCKKLKAAGIDYTEENVRVAVANLVTNFGLSDEKAKEAFLTSMLPTGTSVDASISDVTEAGKWLNLRVKVVQLWEPNHKAIAQVGLVGDETGVVKFLTWKKSELPEIEEGMCYFFKNVVVDEYEGKFSVKLNSNSEITPYDGDIEVAPNELTISAPVIKIFEDSGIIMRCPTCNRVLLKGVCQEHGKVKKGNKDLRAKIVMDDGDETYSVIIGRDVLEEMLATDMETIIAKGMDMGDYDFLYDEIHHMLFGRYVIINGHRIGDNVFATEVVA